MSFLLKSLFLLTPLLLFFLCSCKKQESSSQQTIPLTAPVTKRIIEQDTGYIPVLDSIPSTLSLNTLQLKAFYKWWGNRWEDMWTDLEIEHKDSLTLVHLKFSPNFNFIKSLKTPGNLRYQQYIHEQPLRFTCFTDPDTLNELNMPMLTSEASRRLFDQEDSIFLIFSYEHFYELKQNYARNLMCHIFYNYPERKYVLKILDTSGQEHGSIDLFSAGAYPAKSFAINIAIPSSLQVIQRHHEYNEKTGLMREDSSEYKRVFIDTTGTVYDWTTRLVPPQKYCSPVPPDSTFDPHFHVHQDRIRSTPLPYSMQKDILHIKSLEDHEYPFVYRYSTYQFPLFYFQFLIADMADQVLYTVANVSHSTMLVLADKKGKILAAREITPQIRRIDYDYDQFYGRIARDGTIHLVNPYNIPDTLGEMKVVGNNINSTVPRFKALTMPISKLDSYFSYSDVWEYSQGRMENLYEKLSNLKQFPDSIYSCIKEIATANGGQFAGKNYSIMHPSNDLTYLVVYQEGNVDGYLSMYIIDKNNVMQNHYLHLAGGGGDEGDYWRTTGVFLNDSTYTSTGISCSYESHCDSTILIHNIHSDGTITVDEDKTQWYRKPYH